ncbi:heavy-metal-associated domain-containing protein [Patescibacteria group bacterium]|nr:MAG: heavy-metal-associated domain-containing protein [Patescibacteria group bacterium]
MNKNLILAAIILAVAGVIGFRLVTHNNPSNSATQVDAANLRHVTMKVDGMYCASCPYNVENALKDMRGVVNVTVGFTGKEIIDGTVEGRGEVIYDQAQVNPVDMIRAIQPYKGAVLNDKSASSTTLIPLPKSISL